METYRLICHPDTPAKEAGAVSVELAITDNKLWLRYVVDVDVDLLELPHPQPSERADGLWRTTCFELFTRDLLGDGYAEFNFSPSSQWCAYHFSDYREGMIRLNLIQPPEIFLEGSNSHLALEATIILPGVTSLIALSAVIEETDGTKSYWALAHPPGEPDFHHPTCFAATLPAPPGA